MPRKRTYDEMVDSDPPQAPQEATLARKLRNMWEFASVYQFMDMFGQVVKIPKIDIEDFESECLKPGSSIVIEEIGLQLLKWVSSHRGINLENWDEWARRQYQQKAPSRPHPYGEEEEPRQFRDFHIFEQLRTIHQLAVWAFWNPDRIRQAMPDVKEADQYYDWQAHPIGWDRQDRTYYELSNRLYRRVDPAVPETTKAKTKPKYTSKKAAAQRRKERSSKRRKVADVSDGDTEMNDADYSLNETQVNINGVESHEEADPTEINTLGPYMWECVAVTLEEFRSFVASIAKSKDPNERNLKEKVEDDMIPELEAVEERRQRKMEARVREIQMAERMQGAKRSGRLAAKQEREREEAEAADAERQRQALLQAARREEEKQQQLDDDRRSRMLTREQRIKEREYKRILMEEQLARDAEEQERVEREGSRGSRQLKERIEKNKKELEELEEDEWTFDCSGCSKYGKNFDDGQHSIACERCNVWQHSKCLGFTKSAAERDDFHFICADCRRKEEEASRPKISLKFKLGQSSSPPQPRRASPNPEPSSREQLVSVDVPPRIPSSRPSVSGTFVNGQFYPTPDMSTIPAAMSQTSFSQITQPSLPGYAMRPAPQSGLHTNGARPFTNITYENQRPHLNPPFDPASEHQPSFSPQPLLAQARARPSSSHSHTPRPTSGNSPPNGSSSPIRQRIPSPMINRPTMSPTQGNLEVGPIAGLPGSSPSLQPASVVTPYTNGNHHTPHDNGTLSQGTPNQTSFTPNASFSTSRNGNQQMSGLSPTKQRISATPIPTPTLVPRKSASFTTPSSSFTNGQNIRSVSGTPIFPPAENLAPSPQQLNREPVPTPSKQSIPSPPPLIESGSGQLASLEVPDAPATADKDVAATEPTKLYHQQGTVQ